MTGVVGRTAERRYGDRPVRLMAVGDSATLGSGRDFTWRYRLWEHLELHPHPPVQFVGPEEAMWDGVADAPVSLSYAEPGFDRRHFAVWGATLRSMAADIAAAVSAYAPDILLVQLGINDLAWYCGAEDALDHLRAFIEAAREGDPEIAVVFEPVLPTQRLAIDPGFAEQVALFTARAPALVARLDRPASPLRAAAVAGAYDAQGDTYDGSHPNARGEIKVAASFADALHEHFGVGAPYGPIPEQVPGGVPAPQTPTAVTRTTSTVLTWPAVSDADAYNIYRRHVSGGQESFERLAWPVLEPRFGDDYLFNGHVYEFRVSALVGNVESPPSSVVRVAPEGPRPDAPVGLVFTPATGEPAPGDPSDPSSAGVGRLGWGSVDGVVGYYVYSRDATDVGPWVRREFTIPETSLDVPPRSDGHTWEYRITAFGYAGESDPTQVVAVPPPSPRPGPTPSEHRLRVGASPTHECPAHECPAHECSAQRSSAYESDDDHSEDQQDQRTSDDPGPGSRIHGSRLPLPWIGAP